MFFFMELAYFHFWLSLFFLIRLKAEAAEKALALNTNTLAEEARALANSDKKVKELEE